MLSYQLFRSFLRDHECERAFDSAFFAYNGGTLLDASLWELGDAECIFAQAFVWHTTPEGRDFWRNLDREWYNLYSNWVEEAK